MLPSGSVVAVRVSSIDKMAAWPPDPMSIAAQMRNLLRNLTLFCHVATCRPLSPHAWAAPCSAPPRSASLTPYHASGLSHAHNTLRVTRAHSPSGPRCPCTWSPSRCRHAGASGIGGARLGGSHPTHGDDSATGGMMRGASTSSPRNAAPQRHDTAAPEKVARGRMGANGEVAPAHDVPRQPRSKWSRPRAREGCSPARRRH